MRNWWGLVVWTAVTGAALAAGPAHAGAPAPEQISMEGCAERRGFVNGDDAAIRARVPARYELVGDRNGRPLLLVQGIRCERLTVDGHSAPAHQSQFFALIRPPDGRSCAQRLTPPGAGDPFSGSDFTNICNFYPLSWGTSHPRFAEWLRHGTPEFPARVVPGLSLTLSDFDPEAPGEPFRFDAPVPSQSPHVLEGVARRRPGTFSFTISFWVPVAGGQVVVRAAVETDNGEATGTVTPEPGSEMDALIGGPRPFLQGYHFFGANHWATGSYTKTVIPD